MIWVHVFVTLQYFYLWKLLSFYIINLYFITYHFKQQTSCENIYIYIYKTINIIVLHDARIWNIINNRLLPTGLSGWLNLVYNFISTLNLPNSHFLRTYTIPGNCKHFLGKKNLFRIKYFDPSIWGEIYYLIWKS